MVSIRELLPNAKVVREGEDRECVDPRTDPQLLEAVGPKGRVYMHSATEVAVKWHKEPRGGAGQYPGGRVHQQGDQEVVLVYPVEPRGAWATAARAMGVNTRP